MARIEITYNFNDAVTHPIPDLGVLPTNAGNVAFTGGEVNAAEVTDTCFNNTGTAPVAGKGTKNYGAGTPTEGRFLRKRLLGY